MLFKILLMCPFHCSSTVQEPEGSSRHKGWPRSLQRDSESIRDRR